MKRISMMTTASLLMAISQGGFANIVNGSFSPDFMNWSGETTDADSFTPASVDPDTDLRFSLFGSGMAQIDTFPDNDLANNIFAVDLFQVFDVPIDVTTLAFDYAWSITDPDPGFDFVSAIISDVSNSLSSIDLFDGLFGGSQSATGHTVDISSLAGETVLLNFHIEDGGDDQQDWLRIGNIEVNQATTNVGLPGTLMLFGIGMVGFAGRRMLSHSATDTAENQRN